MTEEEKRKLRLQCLQIAINEKIRNANIETIERAEEFYKFITK